jgi:hypothetical protein
MSGAAILEKPTNADGTEALYPADAIGIVPVYGYWGVKDGRMTYCGIPRRGRNPQIAYNYHMSEQLAYMASAPKSPFIAGMRAMRGEGVKALWERAAVDTRATLVYNDWDEETNTVIPAPTRASISVNLQNHIEGANQALADLEATIGMYRANLGAPSNETSGVAIDARKEQGEASTSHFPQNLAASLGQVGRICLQMIPKLIDTKRQQRILGIDNKPSTVVIDPEQSQAMLEGPQGEVSINLGVGSYDVRVVVGASYSTQRSQAQEALATVMQANPGLTPAIAPLWAQQLDFPHADKLAQVLTAMAPEPVQAILNPDAKGKPTVEQLMAQNQQLQQTMQMMQEAGAHLQQEGMELKVKLEDKTEADRIAWHKAETDRLKVTGANAQQIQVIVEQLMEQMVGPLADHVATLTPPMQPEGMEPQGMPMDPMQGMQPEMPPDPMGAMPEQQPQGPLDAGFSPSEAMQ